MGTHPIFESDFDCLTDSDSLEKFQGEIYRSKLGKTNMPNVRSRPRKNVPYKPPPIRPKTSQVHYNSMSWEYVLIMWTIIALLDIFLKFRLEYLYPIYLVISKTHDLWRSSSLSSLFFLVVTITMDMTIFSISKNDNEHLFVVAGFFVWIHLVYSGDNKVAIPTFAVASLIVALEFLMTYHFPLRQTQIVKGEYLRPIAAHCIGYPLVSIGYCLKGYMAYLLRLRKQGEVENKNKFYYQLLHEALPPENYHSYKYHELDPDESVGDQGSNHSSDVANEPSFEQKYKESSPSWPARLLQYISDIQCFHRNPRSPLVRIKNPSSSLGGVKSSHGGSRVWESVWRHLAWAFSWLSVSRLRGSSGPSRNSGQNSASQSSTSEPPSVHNSNSEPPTQSKSTGKTKPGKPVKDSSAKVPSHPKKSPKSLENQENAENSQKYPSPVKKPVEKRDDPTPLMEIPRDDLAKNTERSPNSPNRQLDLNEAENKRLLKELNRFKKIEIDLKNKIKDLVQHEDFTREELESVRKRENSLRSSLLKEKERRIELENGLKREEEAKKSAERNLAEERRKNQNVLELEQARLKVQRLELENDNLRKETNSRVEESLKYKEESCGRENKIKQVEDILDKERAERRHIKMKLDEESRLSRNLLIQLNERDQLIAQLKKHVSDVQEEMRHRRSPHSPSPSPGLSSYHQSPVSPNSSFSNSAFGRFPDPGTIDQFD